MNPGMNAIASSTPGSSVFLMFRAPEAGPPDRAGTLRARTPDKPHHDLQETPPEGRQLLRIVQPPRRAHGGRRPRLLAAGGQLQRREPARAVQPGGGPR